MVSGLHGAFVLILAEKELKHVHEAVCWAKENAMDRHMQDSTAMLRFVQVKC